MQISECIVYKLIKYPPNLISLQHLKLACLHLNDAIYCHVELKIHNIAITRTLRKICIIDNRYICKL